MRALSAVVACLLVSCIGTKEFTIETDPEGATITINGEPQNGKTPMTLEINQGKNLGIVASKPGYETAAETVRTRTSWWMALLWTKNDPRAQYIEEDKVKIHLEKIPTLQDFRPTALPSYNAAPSKAPALRPMPENLVP